MRLDAPPAQAYVPTSVLNHEAWHAVAAVCLRIPLREVRADRPIDTDPGTLGLATLRQVGSRSGLRRGLAVVLAPWCAEGRPFDWPLDPNAGGDETAARVLCDVLELSRGEYQVCVETTNDFVRLPSAKRAVTAVAHALREDGVLSGGRVHQLVLGDAPAPFSRTVVMPGASPSPGVGRDLTESSPPSGSHVAVQRPDGGY
jgi:hypothetical protein